jgi:BlaI family penicillinase repressor
MIKTKTLTKAEEGIMQVLWELGKGFLGEIIQEIPNPKPHQNTVATILKIMVTKQIVGIESFGMLKRYYPLVTKKT